MKRAKLQDFPSEEDSWMQRAGYWSKVRLQCLIVRSTIPDNAGFGVMRTRIHHLLLMLILLGSFSGYSGLAEAKNTNP
jgi:hypothetical protein